MSKLWWVAARVLLTGLLALAGCNNANTTLPTANAVSGEPTILIVDVGLLGTAGVAVGADEIPAGSTITIFRGTLIAPAGMALAGPAMGLNFSAPLTAGSTATIRVPFAACLVREQGAVDSDIVLVVATAAGVTIIPNVDLTVNADETVTAEIAGNATVSVAVPAGALDASAPLVGMGNSGIAVVDGRVWTWGQNFAGQLGNGTTMWERSPMRVEGIFNAVSVEAAPQFSVALLANGQIRTWGDNSRGQLGDGTFTSSLVPVTARPFAPQCFTRIAVGGTSFAVLAQTLDGHLYSWGSNLNGQLGIGTNEDSPTPERIEGLHDPVDFAIGQHALAVDEDGAAWAWGNNDKGQLGDGTLLNSNVPVAVPDLTERVIAVAIGGKFSLALMKDGTVWAWGSNEFGQLGVGLRREELANRREPARVLRLSGIIAIDAGAATGYALDRFGDVWTWGAGEDGQLGDGTVIEQASIPSRALIGGIVIDIDAGPRTAIAAMRDGTHQTWGFNGGGETGDGTVVSPRRFPGPLDID